MRIEPLSFRGAFLVQAVHHPDERGAFRTILDAEAAEFVGIDAPDTYVASAFNLKAGTVRGMHYQVQPDVERKTLWCSSGEAFDVLVDLRADEPTYGQWLSVRLTPDTCAVHIPSGIAHGYQTLVDETVLTYVIGGRHAPQSARTLLWADPTVGITWPREVTVVSDKDRDGAPWPPRL